MLAHDAEIVKINGPLVRPEDAMQKKNRIKILLGTVGGTQAVAISFEFHQIS